MESGDIMENNQLEHFGIKGMRWGHRKPEYRSTGIKSFIARRSNKKVDKSFNDWKENVKKRDTAIELGKKSVQSKLSYENNKSDKSLKKQYKIDKRNYKKALQKNTTYRKGQIRSEVGKDISRKYLSEAKKIKKQLDKDPTNKQLKSKYNDLMSKHDLERARARRAPAVAERRSRMKASVKRTFTITARAVVGTAAVVGGAYAINSFLNSRNVTLNGQKVSVSAQNLMDVANVARAGREFLGFLYM